MGAAKRVITCESLAKNPNFQKICTYRVLYNGRKVLLSHVCKGTCRPICQRKAQQAAAAERRAAAQKRAQIIRKKKQAKQANVMFSNLKANCKDHQDFTFQKVANGPRIKCDSRAADFDNSCSIKRTFNGVKAAVKRWCAKRCKLCQHDEADTENSGQPDEVDGKKDEKRD
mmetsp:Transcript_5508/g.11428  ORF Transcript_5508/g.11428 Transcript_5508/m.11428 type:complete len:171 (-) Transcript_5508:150-662(-)